MNECNKYDKYFDISELSKSGSLLTNNRPDHMRGPGGLLDPDVDIHHLCGWVAGCLGDLETDAFRRRQCQRKSAHAEKT